MIIDAKDTVLGRLSSYCAKKALNGEEIIIVNAEQAIISGKREDILKQYKFKRDVGDSRKGPFTPRMPDRIVRRTIRGMISYNTARGKEAYKRVMTYIGEPKEIKGEKTTIAQINKDKLKNANYTTVQEVSKWLGAKV